MEFVYWFVVSYLLIGILSYCTAELLCRSMTLKDKLLLIITWPTIFTK